MLVSVKLGNSQSTDDCSCIFHLPSSLCRDYLDDAFVVL